MGARGPTRGNQAHPVTPERVALFLHTYRESGGNFRAAAEAACPGRQEGDRRPCYSTFVKLKKSDMGFAAACEEVLIEAADLIDAEIDRRGRLGWLDPIVQKGEHVRGPDGELMYIRRFDSKLLLARARALMPDKYGEKKTVDLIHHKASGGMMVVESSDIPALSPDQRKSLMDIMGTIRAARDGTKQIEHQPGVTLEVPIVEREPVLVEVVREGEPEAAAETFPAWED